MNPNRSRFFGATCFWALLPVLSLNILFSVSVAFAADLPKANPKQAAKLVDAIVNRNKEPKLVERRSGGPRIVAIFPANYDWKEDERVRKALDTLYQADPTVELWDELVRRSKDMSYCMIFTSPVNDDAESFRVRRIADALAYYRLVHVFLQHVPTSPDGRGRLRVRIGDVSKWRMERKDKAIYELQIEAGEIALIEVPKLKHLSKKEKHLARRKIEAEIEKLKKTKRPLFLKYSEFWQPFLGVPYDRKLAALIREAVMKGSSRSFYINK
jgi:hypothetical protein